MPAMPEFKKATCRGCYALGTACGHCERCLWERENNPRYNSYNTKLFKPSQVNLSKMFVDTFRRMELEATAAIIVKILATNGDTWRTATCTELAEGFKALVKEEGPWRQRFNNPFVRVDMHGLVAFGFAQWEEDGKAISFTESGLDQMKKWVRRVE